MSDYFLPLKAKREIAEGTVEFSFERPKDFEFKAGQSVDITLGTYVYSFSLSSSPNNREIISTATRMRDSEFKKKLGALAVGEKIRIQGPSGDFVLRKKTEMPIVLVAGGIGITPYMSMLRWANEEKLPHQITLLYFNSSKLRTAYFDELEKIENKNIKIEFLYGKAEFKADAKNFYYLCGPPGMVATSRRILDEEGIDEDNIRTEEFSGY